MKTCGNQHINAVEVFEGTLYACGTAGACYQSTDWGATWTSIGAGLPFAEVLCLTAMRSADGGYVYCGTISAGIWRRPLGGGAWVQVSNGIASSQINSMVTKDSCVIAGTQHGIYRSRDYGASWSLVSGGTTSTLTKMHALHPGEGSAEDILVAGRSGIPVGNCLLYSTQDNGAFWSTSPNLLWGRVLSITDVGGGIFALVSGTADHGQTPAYISQPTEGSPGRC